MGELNQPGVFKAIPLSWSVIEAKGTESVGIDIEYRITAKRNLQDEWDDWSGYAETRVSGVQWIIKKDGSEGEFGIEALVRPGIWSGELMDIPNGPNAVEVQVEVELDTYGKTPKYKVKWVNVVSSSGGANIDALAARYGAKIRAVASGIRVDTGSNEPLATPPPPARVDPPAPPAQTTNRTPPPGDDDDLPF